MPRPTIPLLAVVLSTACGPVEPYEPADPDTLARLNQELVNVPSTRMSAEDQRHFRPLCDRFGFPLVGNIQSKGGITASEFCASIRKP